MEATELLGQDGDTGIGDNAAQVLAVQSGNIGGQGGHRSQICTGGFAPDCDFVGIKAILHSMGTDPADSSLYVGKCCRKYSFGRFAVVNGHNCVAMFQCLVDNRSNNIHALVAEHKATTVDQNDYGSLFHAVGSVNVTDLIFGQTAIADILDAINAVNAKCVFVFPNNGNVVLAAQQAAELAEKEVHVIPTKNVAMGIAAAVAFQPDVSGEENAARMTEAANHVKTGTVTYAVRDSEYNGVQIHKDDIIGMHNGQIEYSGNSVHDVVMEMMTAIIDDEAELITVYYGADVSKEDAEGITAEIAEKYPDCDCDCLLGGQPLYYYLISVE